MVAFVIVWFDDGGLIVVFTCLLELLHLDVLIVFESARL